MNTPKESDFMDKLSNEQLLDIVDRDRNNKLMIDELISRKVYPKETVPGNPNTVYEMVSGWGAYWHVWEGRNGQSIVKCPLCGADLRDYESGPPGCRVIAMYSMNLDKTVSWKCPDCNGSWKRE